MSKKAGSGGTAPLEFASEFGAAGARLDSWRPDHWPVATDWRPLMDTFLSSQSGRELAQFLQLRLADHAVIYPPQPFAALALTPLQAVRVVILGQDPYHGPGQAQGLAFSVARGQKLPPSLRNIFKELEREIRSGALPVRVDDASPHGDLRDWTRQGVLLLNTCLTVEQGCPASHFNRGWELLTQSLLRAVAAKTEPVAFLLWGGHAQKLQPLLQAASPTGAARLLLCANHPSPLSALRPPRPFLGCGHFSQTNAFLVKNGGLPINW